MNLETQDGSPLRLAYCTNVVRADDVTGVHDAVESLWADVCRRVDPPGSLGLGLWFPTAVANELAGSVPGRADLAERLAAHDLELVTVNAFPAEAFHADVVKKSVYLPAWDDPARAAYTSAVAWAVAGLVPPGSDIPVSTLPLGFPKWDDDRRAVAAQALLETVVELDRLQQETGTTIRLALEPEPCCALERTDEALDFFTQTIQPSAAALGRVTGRGESAGHDLIARHLGICLDLCHTAVEHEDAVEALDRYRGASVSVHKVQVSAALEVPDPTDPEQRALLEPFAEERWLHQVGAPLGTDARVLLDIRDALGDPRMSGAGPWRVHFHVPLDATHVGGLPTTGAHVRRFLEHVATLEDAPVLELETYTWSVVPGASDDLAENVAREIRWARDALLRGGCRLGPKS